MKDTSLMGIASDDSLPEDKDKEMFSPRKDLPIDNNASTSNTCNSNPETGSDDERIDDSLPHQPGFTPSLMKVKADKSSNNESSQQHVEGELEVNTDEVLSKGDAVVCEVLEIDRKNYPEDVVGASKSKDGKQTEAEDIENEDHCTGQVSHFTCLHSLPEKFTQIPDLKECMYPVCQEEEAPLVRLLLDESMTLLDKQKAEENGSSKERTRSLSHSKDSCGSVRSSNSAETVVTGKRVRSFGEDIFTDRKRLRKSSDESSCSRVHLEKDSSFVNWISNVTKGFFRSETHSLSLVPDPMPIKQKSPISASSLNDSDNYPAPRAMGFGSFLKTFHWPRQKGKKNKIINVNNLGVVANSTELQLGDLTNEKNSNRGKHVVDTSIQEKPCPITSPRIDQGICQFGEPTPVLENMSMLDAEIQEVKINIEENYKNVDSSSSSPHDFSCSPSEQRETNKIGPHILSENSNVSTGDKVSRIPGNVWITRFLPKIAARTGCTNQFNLVTPFKPEKNVDECNVLLHCAQNDREHVKDYQFSEECHHFPLEDRKPTESLPEYSVNPVGLACLKKPPPDPRAKFNLNPILPSQKFRRLEPMASVFAKRLDAFRHIQTSEVSDDIAPESSTCLYCGKNGHFITSCSDVTESVLDDLLKNTCSIGPAEKSSSQCIRCFQQSHWAIACPYASLSSYQKFHGDTSIDCESFPRTRGSDPVVSNHGVKICEKVKDQRHQLFGPYMYRQSDTPRNVTELMVQTSLPDKRDTTKGKKIISNSVVAEVGGKSSSDLCSLIKKERPDEQARIFERIRKLQLSRTDITRLMDSSISQFSLGGFFLRVKLGKGDEGPGGACYHVACISGTTGENDHGGGKGRLPVCIGGLKCLIDSRFISNHDFVEDELKAWWSTTLQRGGHLPSEVDLNKKLQEKATLKCLS